MGGRSRLITLPSPEATHAFGRHAASLLPLNSIIAISGPLGAGKTSFVQGLAEGLTISTPIQSPTFTYLNIYKEGRAPLYHFDLYRMKEPSDFFSLGFDEYFEAGGLTAIEWPERLAHSLPSNALRLIFSYQNGGRSLDLSSPIDHDLVDSLAEWDS
jgi:tRNA threonylcarbamoyladenosine biosynthesis protein TsaE